MGKESVETVIDLIRDLRAGQGRSMLSISIYSYNSDFETQYQFEGYFVGVIGDYLEIREKKGASILKIGLNNIDALYDEAEGEYVLTGKCKGCGENSYVCYIAVI